MKKENQLLSETETLALADKLIDMVKSKEKLKALKMKFRQLKAQATQRLEVIAIEEKYNEATTNFLKSYVEKICLALFKFQEKMQITAEECMVESESFTRRRYPNY